MKKLLAPASRAEIARYRHVLRSLIARSGKTQLEIQAELGWGRAELSHILRGYKALRFDWLLTVLETIGCPPAAFFAEMSGLPLPGARGFPLLRPWSGRRSLRHRAAETLQGAPPFHVHLTGHRGAGKTTELQRLLQETLFQEDFLLLSLELPEPRSSAGILAEVARLLIRRLAAASLLPEELGNVARDLRLRADIDLPPDGREALRELLQQLVACLHQAVARPLLLVVDGLDTWTRPVRHLLWDHHPLSAIPLSTITVIPVTAISNHHRLPPETLVLPPLEIPARETEDMPPEAERFYDDLLDLFLWRPEVAPPARETLLRLSGGIPRAMIERTRQAFVRSRKPVIDRRTALRVWRDAQVEYRKILSIDDFQALYLLAENPRLGIPDLGRLLEAEAVLQHADGSHRVHPAVWPLLPGGGPIP